MSRSLRIELLEDPGRLPQAWDARVRGASHLLQRSTLSALATAALPGTRMFCGLAWLGEDLVAAGVFHLVPFEPRRTGRTVAESHWVTGAFLRLTGLSGGPPHLLLCGHWLHTNAPGFTCDAARIDPGRGLQAMMGKVRRHARRSVALEVIKGPDLPDGGRSLESLGHHRVDAAQPTMSLAIQPSWKSWDDYLQQMHKKYRQRARAARKRGSQLEREVLTAQQIGQHAADIDALLDSVLEHAEVVLIPPRAATLTWRISVDPDALSGAVFSWTYSSGDGGSCDMIGGIDAIEVREDCGDCVLAADFTLGASDTALDEGACDGAALLNEQLTGVTYGWGHGETVLEASDGTDTHALMVNYGDDEEWSAGGRGSWLIPASEADPGNWTFGQDDLAL